jgi:hypothetical protein
MRYQAARDIWKRLSHSDKWSIGQADVARILYLQGDFENAFSAIRVAKKSAPKNKNLESLAYCYLTEIELHSRLRDSVTAKKAYLEYRHSNSFKLALHNSVFGRLILTLYHFERREFEEGLIELLSAAVIQLPLDNYEYQPDIMVILASYLNYERKYEDAIAVLLKCYDVSIQLRGYRHGLFLRWLETLELSLRGLKKLNLAGRISNIIFQYLKDDLVGTDNSALGDTRSELNLGLLERAINDIRGLQPQSINIAGLHINLSSGDVFKEGELVKLDQLKGLPLIVFRLFARNRGKFFANREIIRSYDERTAELDKPPRRDNYFIPFLQDFFYRLCGNKIIENRRGYGYRIPKDL